MDLYLVLFYFSDITSQEKEHKPRQFSTNQYATTNIRNLNRTFERNIHQLQKLNRSLNINSRECLSVWRLNGIINNKCVHLVEPDRCICATRVHPVTQELLEWKHCSNRKCMHR